MSKSLSTAAVIIVLGSVPALATNYHVYRPWKQTQTQAQPHYAMRDYGGPNSSMWPLAGSDYEAHRPLMQLRASMAQTSDGKGRHGWTAVDQHRKASYDDQDHGVPRLGHAG
jgi:hypothetical protein